MLLADREGEGLVAGIMVGFGLMVVGHMVAERVVGERAFVVFEQNGMEQDGG